jgi:hypothetical protein
MAAQVQKAIVVPVFAQPRRIAATAYGFATSAFDASSQSIGNCASKS